MPEMRSVFSSNVSRIGYDADSAELHVHFGNGSEVVYHDVPSEVARRVLAAPSIGEALWANVRGQFEHRYNARARGRGQ
jgi:hypothetical protein